MMAWGWSPPPSSPASASVTESVAEAPVRNQSLHNLPQALSLVLQLLQLHLPYCRLLLLTVLQLSPPYAPAISQAMSPTFLWLDFCPTVKHTSSGTPPRHTDSIAGKSFIYRDFHSWAFEPIAPPFLCTTLLLQKSRRPNSTTVSSVLNLVE